MKQKTAMDERSEIDLKVGRYRNTKKNSNKP